VRLALDGDPGPLVRGDVDESLVDVVVVVDVVKSQVKGKELWRQDVRRRLGEYYDIEDA
jgi:hypothetical protein